MTQHEVIPPVKEEYSKVGGKDTKLFAHRWCFKG